MARRLRGPGLAPRGTVLSPYLQPNAHQAQWTLSPRSAFSDETNGRQSTRLARIRLPSLRTGSRFSRRQEDPQWTPRSRRGVFVGVSALHSSESPLILNLLTGKISPQYHVVFDDAFTTVSTVHDSLYRSRRSLPIPTPSSMSPLKLGPTYLRTVFSNTHSAPVNGSLPSAKTDAWYAREQSLRTRTRQSQQPPAPPLTIDDYIRHQAASQRRRSRSKVQGSKVQEVSL
jgi:hypothetical protein